MQDLKTELANWKGRKVLMVIFPHPDDETMGAGGLLLVAKSLGWKTIAVILTAGGAGQMHIHPKGKSVKEVRTNELHKAIRILKVDTLILGKFDDGKLRALKPKWNMWVKGLIKKHNPGWVVTYDLSGISGHPDHISVSLALRKVPAKLWWSSWPKIKKLGNPAVLAYRTTPTHVLNMGKLGNLKLKAKLAHASQKLPRHIVLYRYEWYHEVEAKKVYPYKFVDFKI